MSPSRIRFSHIGPFGAPGGASHQPPALAVTDNGGGALTVYASWNGANRHRLLAAAGRKWSGQPHARGLGRLDRLRDRDPGYHFAAVSSHPALGANGQTLGTSAAVQR